MTKTISVRVDAELLSAIESAPGRDLGGRSEIVREALELWLKHRRLQDMVKRHCDGYQRFPAEDDEFAPVLGAQTWPK